MASQETRKPARPVFNTIAAAALLAAFATGPALAEGPVAASAPSCLTCAPAVSAGETVPALFVQIRQPGTAVGSATQVPGVPGAFAGDVEPRGPACCPPIASQPFARYFVQQQSPGKNVTQTYGYNFVATPALDAQMNAFAPFAALFVPAGKHPVALQLSVEVRSWTSNLPPPNWTSAGSTDVFVGKRPLRWWWTNGSGANNGSGFNQTLWDNQAVSPLHFDPNRSYIMRLTLRVHYKDTPNDNTWYAIEVPCMERFVRRGSLVQATRLAPGAPDPAALQDVPPTARP